MTESVDTSTTRSADIPTVVASGIAQGALGYIGASVLSSMLGSEESNVGARLQRIEESLEEIHNKLDDLTGLVKAIPDAVGERINWDDLNKRWTYLESVYDTLIEDGGPGEIADEQFRADIRHAWLSIVEYENRPQRLFALPLWTEFVRVRLGVPRGSTSQLYGDIAEKSVELDEFIEELTEDTSELIKSALAIFDRRYQGKSPRDKANQVPLIVNGAVRDSEPYVTWRKHRDIKVKRARAGLFAGSTRRPHKRFRRHRDAADRKLQGLRSEICSNMSKIKALTPAAVVIKQYVVWLAAPEASR